MWEGVGARGEAQRFRELWGIGGTMLVDAEGAVVDLLQVRGVPCNVFVDADGTVLEVGAVTPEDLERTTRRLLGPDADVDEPENRDWHWEKAPDHIARHIAGFEAFHARADDDGDLTGVDAG